VAISVGDRLNLTQTRRVARGQRRCCPRLLDDCRHDQGFPLVLLLPNKGTLPLPFGVPPECHATAQPTFSSERRVSDRSDQMRLRTLVVTLAVAAPLLALESKPAAACWGWGTSSYGYSAPRSYGYYGYAPRTYGYAPSSYGYYGYAPRRFYGGAYYGRRLGWRGYGYRGSWRGYGYRGIGVGRVGVGRVGGYGYRGIGVRRAGVVGVGRVGVGRVGVGRIGRGR
jgi:hypothetical protein